MTTRSRPSDRLTELRPPDLVDPAGLSAAQDLVTARIAADEVPDLRDRLPRRRSTAARVGLVGAAAAAVAAVTLVLPNPSDTPAFAGWTAVPASVTADELEAAGEKCLALRTGAAAEVPADQRDGLDNLQDAQPVIADRRGSTTFTVLRSDAGLQSCLIGPSVATSFVVSGAGGSASTGRGTSGAEPEGEYTSIGIVGDDTPPGADGASFVSGGVENATSDEPWGFGLGRVGADVASVELELTDGSTVEATVEDGTWAAWWPSTASVAEVRPTLADGSAGTSPQIDVFDVDAVLEGAVTGEPGGTEDVGTSVAED
ncbi:hypothetical protein [Cellulomonas palmilytica]|uniref:hypothetical protein n=1 Tax=Cellulomonas palmilytica TaxID=2608402 RepID=UPI001F1C5659|nr:hypothetical protein [Cellulomonas palmilytica]UJP40404.1 hypothetical protein F1D97_02415 [Cellulomonas palmilytica]